MLDYSGLLMLLQQQGMGSWVSELETELNRYFQQLKHGDVPGWQQALQQMPVVKPSCTQLSSDKIIIGSENDVSNTEQQQIIHSLQQLIPWRKGPFNIFGVELDAEWQSNLKWSRLSNKIDLNNKTILDVGCGNGYYALRMLGAGARMVLGIDPTLKFVYQFELVKKYLNDIPVYILPFTLEKLPFSNSGFDTVFSMGVLYHRRNPDEHLTRLSRFLRPQGELIIESLIVDDDYGECLVPDKRYAKMNNVWWIPSIKLLIKKIGQCGFSQVSVLDESITTVEEQRSTVWMPYESLKDFLDSSDPAITVEGYPAPKRAILHAIKD